MLRTGSLRALTSLRGSASRLSTRQRYLIARTTAILPYSHKISQLRALSGHASRMQAAESPELASIPNVAIEFMNGQGETVSTKIVASYPHKPKAVQNLLAGLQELTAGTEDYKSFTSQRWTIDGEGDAIHRHLEFVQLNDVDSFVSRVKEASAELHHDAHFSFTDTKVTITCATHVPSGLSMKDVKLAKKINEISQDFQLVDNSEDSESEIIFYRMSAETHNMDVVHKAKDSCGCQT